MRGRADPVGVGETSCLRGGGRWWVDEDDYAPGLCPGAHRLSGSCNKHRPLTGSARLGIASDLWRGALLGKPAVAPEGFV